ncbi:MAG: hypothetical protein AAFP00_16065 [Bacteroidota bacterium]
MKINAMESLKQLIGLISLVLLLGAPQCSTGKHTPRSTGTLRVSHVPYEAGQLIQATLEAKTGNIDLSECKIKAQVTGANLSDNNSIDPFLWGKIKYGINEVRVDLTEPRATPLRHAPELQSGEKATLYLRPRPFWIQQAQVKYCIIGPTGDQAYEQTVDWNVGEVAQAQEALSNIELKSLKAQSENLREIREKRATIMWYRDKCEVQIRDAVIHNTGTKAISLKDLSVSVKLTSSAGSWEHKTLDIGTRGEDIVLVQDEKLALDPFKVNFTNTALLKLVSQHRDANKAALREEQRTLLPALSATVTIGTKEFEIGNVIILN